MPAGLWPLLRRLWRPHHAVQPGPGEELVLTGALQVRRLLADLARRRVAVALQAAQGEWVGSGVLANEGAHSLVVRLRQAEHLQIDLLQWPLNATASGPQGMVLFSLASGSLHAHGVLCADWPEQLIRVQSRRHHRIGGLGRGRHRAWLVWSNASARLAVRDLSEQGVGLEVSAHAWLGGLPGGAAQLQLDDEVLDVPWLEVVHSRAASSSGSAAVGARMLGMAEHQVRTLRRWLLTVQAEAVG
jgi:hypothetical protein